MGERGFCTKEVVLHDVIHVEFRLEYRRAFVTIVGWLDVGTSQKNHSAQLQSCTTKTLIIESRRNLAGCNRVASMAVKKATARKAVLHKRLIIEGP